MKVKELKLNNDLKIPLYVTKEKEVITGTYKALMQKYHLKGLSWAKMHELRTVAPLSREEKLFFDEIKVSPTIFNVANLRKWGFFHIYPLIIAKTPLVECELKEIKENGRFTDN